MNELSKFQRSWLLFKSSVFVIQKEKKLLIFPVLTFVLTGLILLFFLAPVALQKTGYGYGHMGHWKAVGQTLFIEDSSSQSAEKVHFKPLGVAYACLVYFLSMFLATFFNVAFYHEILAALRGELVSVRGGLKFARAKWKSILWWALFAGLVGLIIRKLEENLDFIGQWIVGLIGTAWSVAAVFVIPVIITEETSSNPFTMLKKSALTLKKTWGESLIGYLGLQFGNVLIVIGSVFYFAAAVALAVGLHNFWIVAAAALAWLFSVIAFAYLTSVASQVYRCALFVYASEGTIPEPYSAELLQMAWKTKKI